MTFSTSVVTCFRKYVTFSGRASRSEFWWFQLFQVLVIVCLTVVWETIAPLGELVLLLPGLAVGCRRLHDTGRTGWWLLLVLVPVIGWIILLIFWIEATKAEGDKYGPPEGGAGSLDQEPRSAAGNGNGSRIRRIGDTRDSQ